MNNSGRHDPSIDFLTKPPPRSFSIDVGSMQTNHGSPNYRKSRQVLYIHVALLCLAITNLYTETPFQMNHNSSYLQRYNKSALAPNTSNSTYSGLVNNK
jgi:hypothetical protein